MTTSSVRRLVAIATTSVGLGAAMPTLAATASVHVFTSGGEIEQTFTSTAPHVLADAGTVAAVQFAATPSCYGTACSLDGPAVTAVLAPGAALAEARLSYSVGVLGLPGVVPIILTGQYAVVDPLELPDGSGGTAASATVDVFRQSGTGAFHFLSSCLNYTYYLNESAPPVNCGSGTFRGTFDMETGTSFSVALRAAAGLVFHDPSPSFASAYIDPYFEIDPVWAATHPGYSLVFEAGVGNGQANVAIPSPVPEPETLGLLVAGFAVVAGKCRRRDRPRVGAPTR